jgi:hypothetical protein
MARNRTPKAKAEVSGASITHPERYRDRTAPRSRPIGEPYERMTAAEREVWTECVQSMPWLRAHHRMLLRQACVLAARMDSNPGMGTNAHQALSAMLSKLGATPVDDTKVNHGEGGEVDPADRFFSRSH